MSHALSATSARDAYARDGFLILRDLIPHDDLPALRQMAEAARLIARRESGDQTQRIQPWQYVAEVDLAPYHRLRQGVGRAAALDLLGPGFDVGYAIYHGEREPWHYPTVLFEPKRDAYAIRWHRDWRDNIQLPGIREAWQQVWRDPRLFTQFNWALYDDRSLWVVPGSHARDDTAEERAAFAAAPAAEDRIHHLPPAQQEAAWLDYVRAMPGALRVELAAGDLVIYRNTILHTGCYAADRPRATLHDGVMTDAFHAWKDRWHACEKQVSGR